MCSFYRKFIQGFSAIAKPLTTLTKSNIKWKWTHVEQQSFDQLKKRLTEAPVLALPSEEGQYEITTDASNTSLGGVLSMNLAGNKRPIAFASRVLTDTESRYSVTEKEAAAVAWAVEKFRPYIESRHFILWTDHRPLLAIRSGTHVNSKLTRWALMLQAYNFDIKHIPGAQNRVADFLSRTSEEEEEEVKEEQKTHVIARLELPSPSSNEPAQGNIANASFKMEYGSKQPPPNVEIPLAPRDLSTLCADSRDIEFEFSSPRDLVTRKLDAASDSSALDVDPQEADCLYTGLESENEEEETTTNDATTPNNGQVQAETIDVPLAKQQENDPEIGPLYKFLRDATVQPPFTKRDLKKKTKNFVLQNGVLMNVLKGVARTAVPKVLRNQVLHNGHADISSGHFGITRTLKKIRQSYVWPNMRNDIVQFVRCCLTCQQYKHDQRPRPGVMASRKISSVWEICNTDLCGPFPTSISGNSHLLVFQDEYSKAVELVPIKKANAITIARKFVEIVISRHGCPRYLKSDNGAVYCSKILASVCKVLGVQQHHILPYRPQANPSERAIKDISRILASYTGSRHDKWDKNIHLVSLAVNTAYQFSTKYAPFDLLYGRQLRLPAIPDDHLYGDQEPMPQEQYAQELRESLKVIFSEVTNNIKKAHERQKRGYDSRRRKDVRFEIGDYVWLASHHLSDAAAKFSAKLAPKRHGPYKVTEQASNVLYTLSDVRTGEIKKAHVDQLQVYYYNGQPLQHEENEEKEFGDPGTPVVTPSTGVDNRQSATRQQHGSRARQLWDPQSDNEEEELICGFRPCSFPDATDWIFCDLCDSPFHTSCVDMTLTEAEQMDFVCYKCRIAAV